jgi:hypothetical protein
MPDGPSHRARPRLYPTRAKTGASSQIFLCWQRRNSITCVGTCVTLWVKGRRRSLSTGCFDSSLATTGKLSRLSEEVRGKPPVGMNKAGWLLLTLLPKPPLNSVQCKIRSFCHAYLDEITFNDCQAEFSLLIDDSIVIFDY